MDNKQWINTEQLKRLLGIKSDQTIAKIQKEIYTMGLDIRWIAKNIETTEDAALEYSKRKTAQKFGELQ